MQEALDTGKESARKKQDRLRRRKREIENAMDVDAEIRRDILASQVLVLSSSGNSPNADGSTDNSNGGGGEVVMTRWHPTNAAVLVSASSDSGGRVWSLPAGHIDAKSSSLVPAPLVLNHQHSNANAQANGSEPAVVTVVSWSHLGDYIASATQSGVVRLWTASGKQLATSDKHSDAVVALAWNRSDSVLLSCSGDSTVIAWSVPAMTIIKQFNHHRGPVLDIAWRDEQVFASCSRDRSVCVVSLAPAAAKSEESNDNNNINDNQNTENGMLQRFEGHLDTVNVVEWSPDGKYIASASDDKTAKVWHPTVAGGTETKYPVADLKGHLDQIYKVLWAPTGPGSRHPHLPSIVATASADKTVRLWSVETGKCLKELKQHTRDVYAISFNPNGRHLASGGFDGRVVVWSIDDGAITKQYHANSPIFDISWNSDGTKVACALEKNATCVFDFTPASTATATVNNSD